MLADLKGTDCCERAQSHLRIDSADTVSNPSRSAKKKPDRGRRGIASLDPALVERCTSIRTGPVGSSENRTIVLQVTSIDAAIGRLVAYE
jgi:hypothetical protein